ncbi:MAG: hypothetical protein ACUVWN_17760 [bacterium]
MSNHSDIIFKFALRVYDYNGASNLQFFIIERNRNNAVAKGKILVDLQYYYDKVNLEWDSCSYLL